MACQHSKDISYSWNNASDMFIPRESRCALRFSSTVRDIDTHNYRIAERYTIGLTREKKYPVQILQATEALRLVLGKGYAPYNVSISGSAEDRWADRGDHSWWRLGRRQSVSCSVLSPASPTEWYSTFGTRATFGRPSSHFTLGLL